VPRDRAQGRRVSWIVIAKLGAGIAGSHYLIQNAWIWGLRSPVRNIGIVPVDRSVPMRNAIPLPSFLPALAAPVRHLVTFTAHSARHGTRACNHCQER